MSFVSVYVLASCHYILEHRIRFKVGFIFGKAFGDAYDSWN